MLIWTANIKTFECSTRISQFASSRAVEVFVTTWTLGSQRHCLMEKKPRWMANLLLYDWSRLWQAFSIPMSQYWFPMRYDIPSPFFSNYKILPGRFRIHVVEEADNSRKELPCDYELRRLSSTAAMPFSLPSERRKNAIYSIDLYSNAVHLCLSLAYIGRKCWRCFSTFIINENLF